MSAVAERVPLGQALRPRPTARLRPSGSDGCGVHLPAPTLGPDKRGPSPAGDAKETRS